MDDVLMYVLIGVAAFLVGAVIFGFICFKLGIKHRIKTAEAQFDGNMATVFANQKTFAESVKAKAKEELLNSTPDPTKGFPPNGDTKEPVLAGLEKGLGL